jgi:hypothetical protein
MKRSPIPTPSIIRIAEGVFPFVVEAVPRHLPVQFHGQPYWVLDRTVVPWGTVVPQTLWLSQSVIDRRQHVEEAGLQMPIFFESLNGSLGLSLDCAAIGQDGLVYAEQIAPLGNKASTYIRIGVSDILDAVV